MAETVTVASKLPFPLYLQVASSPGVRIEVKGNTLPRGADLVGFQGKPIEFGYALTPGVDAKFWFEWLEEHKDMELVKDHFVFAHTNMQNAKAEARDYETLVTNLDPIDPSSPGRGLEKVGA